jgi:hypothetical protein
MVNGSNGDGKSSLIYTGVIPYAKAGFFKAKYNYWILVLSQCSLKGINILAKYIL